MDLRYKIGIGLIPGIGAINAKRLIAYCGGVEAVFKEKHAALCKIPGIGGITAKSILSQKVIERADEEVSFIKKHGIQALFYLDDNYPQRLLNCDDSPTILYYKGNKDLNVSKVIAIVGTRVATDYGKTICTKIIEELSKYNIMIVSGLAYGIDICAHRASLQHNTPTVGVLGHGLDKLYPPEHTDTAEKMKTNGGILTEYMSKTNPDAVNFPKRNRIVAGMSDATIVIEAAIKGGALITAEIANSYNRDVFAIPGRVYDTYSRGCNMLIKTNKAAMVESGADIADFLGWKNSEILEKPFQHTLFVELTDDEQLLQRVLKENGALSIDSLTIASGMKMGKVASSLLNMEFKGVVKSMPGKIYQLL